MPTGAEQRISIRDTLPLAMWSGLLAGVLEGVVFLVARDYPLINAAHKVSVDGMWLAPLLDTILWLFAGVALLPVWLLLSRFLPRQRVLQIAFVVFFAPAFVTPLIAPEVLKPYGAGVLALGVSVALVRLIGERQEQCLTRFRKSWLLAPIAIALCFTGVKTWAWAGERVALGRLPSDSSAPNVIIVVLDTVRADHLSAHGYTKTKTPNLDRIRAEGTWFSNAWATTSWSLPSQTTILYGRHSYEHGADWHEGKPRAQYPSLGEALQARGYATAAFSSNIAWIVPEYVGRGFIYFEANVWRSDLIRTAWGRRLGGALARVGRELSDTKGSSASRLHSAFTAWLDRIEGRKFFTYFCHMDVNSSGHEGLLSGRNPRTAEAIQQYDRALEELDRDIGELDAELRRRGLADNTILIVTSDHGESFGTPAGDHAPKQHMTSLYPEQLRVPLFVRWPGRIPSGARIDRTVSLQQLARTVTDLVGVNGSPFPGDSLLAPENAAARQPCVLGELRNLKGELAKQSVVCGNWQYIRNLPVDISSIRGTPDPLPDLPAEELYDLVDDPTAKNNLISVPESGAIVSKMQEELQRLTAQAKPQER